MILVMSVTSYLSPWVLAGRQGKIECRARRGIGEWVKKYIDRNEGSFDGEMEP